MEFIPVLFRSRGSCARNSRRPCLHDLQRVAQYRDPWKLGIYRRDAAASVGRFRPLSLGPMDRRSLDRLLVGFAIFSFPTRERTSSWPIERSSRSEEHTSELQSLMRISYAVFCLKKKTN